MALNIAAAEAFTFTAGANSTTQHTYKLTKQFYVKGIRFLSSNANHGDYVKIELIDIDNILGLGENTVLATPINKAYVYATTNSGSINADNPDVLKLPAPNLYIRITYTNTSLLSSVTAYINLALFEDAQ